VKVTASKASPVHLKPALNEPPNEQVLHLKTKQMESQQPRASPVIRNLHSSVRSMHQHNQGKDPLDEYLSHSPTVDQPNEEEEAEEAEPFRIRTSMSKDEYPGKIIDADILLLTKEVTKESRRIQKRVTATQASFYELQSLNFHSLYYNYFILYLIYI
jgi:hypothetical protein